MRSADELVLTMIDAKMFGVTDINQAVITAPTIGMDDRVQGHATANYGLKCAFPAIRHDFGIDTAVALEDTENDGLARGAAATFASDSTSAEVTFINFNFAVRVGRGAFNSAAMRSLILRKIMVTVLRVSPVNCDTSLAVKSIAK